MAKEKMVTRTIEFALVTTMFVNVKTQQFGTTQYKLSGDVTHEKALTYIQKHFDNEEIKHVSVTDYSRGTKLYGMTETKFIENSIELPPRATED